MPGRIPWAPPACGGETGPFGWGDVGVLSGFRGMGYGDLLVRLLLFKALSHGAHFLLPGDIRRGRCVFRALRLL